MKYSKWIGAAAVLVVMITCFLPWAFVPSAQLTIGGMFSSGKQNFGKPGLMNIICSLGALIWFMTPRIWAKRTNIFFCGFNIAWAFRNLIILGRCDGGDCPIRQTALYVMVIASVIMLLMAFIPDIKMEDGPAKGT